ncbi:MAG TPA: hypothetical protein C5S50_04020 [Methanosarcinaceae archaeon]|nr:hypothetical protein [Methanosarcinaceae archaeon]HJH31351.1 hypothetical protein [Methanosarcinaceae archaeon]
MTNSEVWNGGSTYKIEDELFESIKDMVTSNFEFIERKCTDSEYYHLKLTQGKHFVVVKQYYTGNLTIQGKKSELFENVCTLIERNSSPDIDEIAMRFIPSKEIEDVQKEIPSIRLEAENKIKSALGDSYDFLYEIDQKYLVTSQCLFQIIKGSETELPEYSGLFMSASKALEGFAIKLFIDKKEFDIDEIQKDPKSIELSWDKLRKHLPNTKRDKYIIPKLTAEWIRCRNFPLHSDPIRDKEMSLEKAELRLNTICETYNVFYAGS